MSALAGIVLLGGPIAAQPLPDAVRAAGEQLIRESGDPDAFELLPDPQLIQIRHRSSGFVCSLPLTRIRALKVLGDASRRYVECAYEHDKLAELWRVLPSANMVAPAEHLQRWTDSVLSENPGARRIDHKSPIEDHKLVKVLQATMKASIRNAWIEAGSGGDLLRNLVGVADIGAWRLTYSVQGSPDAVDAIGPVAWTSGIYSIADAQQAITAKE